MIGNLPTRTDKKVFGRPEADLWSLHRQVGHWPTGPYPPTVNLNIERLQPRDLFNVNQLPVGRLGAHGFSHSLRHVCQWSRSNICRRTHHIPRRAYPHSPPGSPTIRSDRE